MMKLLLVSLIVMTQAQAWTLNNNFGGAFKHSKVNVSVASDTVCQQGMTVYDLADLVKPAVNNFWNRVPTSKLRLSPSGFYSPFTGININEAILCSPTDSQCITVTAAGKDLVPPVSDIVIACNRDLANFNGNPEVLAVAVPNSFSGKKIKGAMILINDGSPAFVNLSEQDKIGVIAHEIGHAIGLGHPKDNPESLMHYRTVDQRKYLSEDDMDGVTYLYPKQFDACGVFSGIGSTIDTDQGGGGGDGSNFWQMGLSLLALIAIFELRRFRRNPETCTPA